MSESTMRSRVVKALAPLDAVAVENPVLPGTPDVNYAEGWIELKWLRNWPKRETSIVPVEHFTPQQRLFLRRRRRRGGAAWLLLQVGQEWLLFDGAVAADCLGCSTREQLLFKAKVVWFHGLKDSELIECLKLPLPSANASSSTVSAATKHKPSPLPGTKSPTVSTVAGNATNPPIALSRK